MDNTTHFLTKRVNLTFTPDESNLLETFLAKNYIKFSPWLKGLILREIGALKEPISYINRSKAPNVQQIQNEQP